MRSSICVLLAILFIAATCVLSGCQGGSATPQNATPKKMSAGGTIQADPANGKFVVSGNRGTYTVDMSGATVVREGKTVRASDLKEGAFVVVLGTLDGQTLKASKIQLIHDKGQLPSQPAKAGGSPGG